VPTYTDYYWGPSDRAYLAESYDGDYTGNQTALSPAGTMHVVRVKVPAAGPCTSIAVGVQAVGSSLTAGQCFAALFYSSGILLAQSVDQTTNWGGTGQKNATLDGGPYFLHAGEYYVGLWYNGTTGPTLHRASNIVGSSINNGRAAPNFIVATANTGLTTAAPTTIGTQTSALAHWWVALK
jgi:hypothetical protein